MEHSRKMLTKEMMMMDYPRNPVVMEIIHLDKVRIIMEREIIDIFEEI